MTATISQSAILNPVTANVKKSLPSRFFQWATNQDKSYHIGWTCVSIALTAAVMFPVTMFAILLNGMPFWPMLMAIVSLAMVIVVNLAAMPTRYTIPILFIGILVDALAIIISFYIR